MFEFIKRLFKKKPTAEETCPFLIHADINESIVINEVALVETPKKPRARKTAKLKEVKPVPNTVKTASTKQINPKKSKSKKPVTAKTTAGSNIVQLVPPIQKKGRPKKDKNV